MFALLCECVYCRSTESHRFGRDQLFGPNHIVHFRNVPEYGSTFDRRAEWSTYPATTKTIPCEGLPKRFAPIRIRELGSLPSRSPETSFDMDETRTNMTGGRRHHVVLKLRTQSRRFHRALRSSIEFGGPIVCQCVPGNEKCR